MNVRSMTAREMEEHNAYWREMMKPAELSHKFHAEHGVACAETFKQALEGLIAWQEAAQHVLRLWLDFSGQNPEVAFDPGTSLLNGDTSPV